MTRVRVSGLGSRTTAAEQELLRAALALPYWPGSRTRRNYAPKMIRFLKAVDAVRELRGEGR